MVGGEDSHPKVALSALDSFTNKTFVGIQLPPECIHISTLQTAQHIYIMGCLGLLEGTVDGHHHLPTCFNSFAPMLPFYKSSYSQGWIQRGCRGTVVPTVPRLSPTEPGSLCSHSPQSQLEMSMSGSELPLPPGQPGSAVWESPLPVHRGISR